MDSIFEEIEAECERQRKQWGSASDDTRSGFDWCRYLVRYCAKAEMARDGWEAEGGPDSFEAAEQWRQRIVQVAAVAVSALRSYDRLHYEKVLGPEPS